MAEKSSTQVIDKFMLHAALVQQTARPKTAEILIVEDDVDYGEMLIELFSSFDKKAYVALDIDAAKEYLDAHDSEQVRCILLDLDLHGESGTSLLDWLKEKNYDIPVVMNTGGSMEVIKAIRDKYNVRCVRKTDQVDDLMESIEVEERIRMAM